MFYYRNITKARETRSWHSWDFHSREQVSEAVEKPKNLLKNNCVAIKRVRTLFISHIIKCMNPFQHLLKDGQSSKRTDISVLGKYYKDYILVLTFE